MIAAALGNPLTFCLTGAAHADITPAPCLLAAVDRPGAVIADKGYDADAFVDSLRQTGATAVIPPRVNRLAPRTWDRHRYQARHLIENRFARLKHNVAWPRAMTNSPRNSPPSSFSLASACGWLDC